MIDVSPSCARIVIFVLALFGTGCSARPGSAPTHAAAEPAHAIHSTIATPAEPGEPGTNTPASTCKAPAIAGTSVEVGQVEAETPELRCCTYLRTRDGRARAGAPASHVAFVQSGTGIYSAADGALGAVAARSLEREDFALLTMDKPGITVDARGALRFDREGYRQYTLADLVACGRNAIGWALSRSAVDHHAALTLHGHSEGGQMMIRMLAARSGVADPRSPRLDSLDRVERTIVSGLPLEPFASAAERQIAIFMPFEIEAFRDALSNHDDDYLLQHALSTRYLTHPTARQGLDEVLATLAVRRPGLLVDVFHGDRDRNAPLALVRSFASKNEIARRAGQPSLDLHLHVYPGARHYLDRRFDDDVRTLIGSPPL